MEEYNQPRPKANKIVIISVIIGIIFGSLSGAVTTILIQQYYPEISAIGGANDLFFDNKKVVTLDQESAVILAVEKAMPAVVSIVVTKDVLTLNSGQGQSPFDDEFFRDFFGFDVPTPRQQEFQPQQVASGTGFIVSSDGYIITNKHVVFDENAEYLIVTNDGETFAAEVLARDPFNDVAIVKINGTDLPTLPLGDSDSLKIGQNVIAIGNALGEFNNTVSTGIVSGLSRSIVASSRSGAEQIADLIQTDAAINQGNSGGPLLNLLGEVIGVNTAISAGAQNIGFSIPSNEIKIIFDGVRETGEIVRPWLGVRFVMLNEFILKETDLDVSDGALIIRGDTPSDLAIIPGSPADKAGLEENDIILKLNDKIIDTKNPLNVAIRKFKPGDTITLTVLHGDEEKILQATLEKFDPKK